MPSLAMQAGRHRRRQSGLRPLWSIRLDRWLESAGIDDAASRYDTPRGCTKASRRLSTMGNSRNRPSIRTRPPGRRRGKHVAQPSEFLTPLLLLIFAPIGLGLIWLAPGSSAAAASSPRESAAEASTLPTPTAAPAATAPTGSRLLPAPNAATISAPPASPSPPAPPRSAPVPRRDLLHVHHDDRGNPAHHADHGDSPRRASIHVQRFREIIAAEPVRVHLLRRP